MFPYFLAVRSSVSLYDVFSCRMQDVAVWRLISCRIKSSKSCSYCRTRNFSETWKQRLGVVQKMMFLFLKVRVCSHHQGFVRTCTFFSHSHSNYYLTIRMVWAHFFTQGFLITNRHGWCKFNQHQLYLYKAFWNDMLCSSGSQYAFWCLHTVLPLIVTHIPWVVNF